MISLLPGVFLLSDNMSSEFSPQKGQQERKEMTSFKGLASLSSTKESEVITKFSTYSVFLMPSEILTGNAYTDPF